MSWITRLPLHTALLVDTQPNKPTWANQSEILRDPIGAARSKLSHLRHRQAHTDNSAGGPAVPSELIHHIFCYLHNPDLARATRASRVLGAIATAVLFDTIAFRCAINTLLPLLYTLTARPAVARCVRRLNVEWFNVVVSRTGSMVLRGATDRYVIAFATALRGMHGLTTLVLPDNIARHEGALARVTLPALRALKVLMTPGTSAFLARHTHITELDVKESPGDAADALLPYILTRFAGPASWVPALFGVHVVLASSACVLLRGGSSDMGSSPAWAAREQRVKWLTIDCAAVGAWGRGVLGIECVRVLGAADASALDPWIASMGDLRELYLTAPVAAGDVTSTLGALSVARATLRTVTIQCHGTWDLRDSLWVQRQLIADGPPGDSFSFQS